MAFLDTPDSSRPSSAPSSPRAAFSMDLGNANDILDDRTIQTTYEVTQKRFFEEEVQSPVSPRSESGSSSEINFRVTLEQPGESEWSTLAKKIAKIALVLIVITGIFVGAGIVLSELSVSVHALAIVGGVSVVILGTGWLLSRASKKQPSEESSFQKSLRGFYREARNRRARGDLLIRSRSNSSSSSLSINVLDSDSDNDDVGLEVRRGNKNPYISQLARE